MLEATIAYAFNRKGELRPAITAMRRAYPQFMADGGEALPRSILTRHLSDRLLDPDQAIRDRAPAGSVLVAALVAQESTFQADVRSAANAWGLMQIEPATGRRYASGSPSGAFTTSRLTDPETNIRIGTARTSRI